MIKFINVILFFGMIVMNYLANALPINNKTTGQLSDALPNLFVPAGLTFSIWGVIYLLLATYCVIQFRSANQAVNESIGWLFSVSCLLNALWIVAWHYQRLPLSLLVMAGLLVSLIYINMMIRDLPFGIIKASFGIYLGWICIASIANVTALLVYYDWGGFGMKESTWAIILILTGALIVSAAIFQFKNPFIGLSVVWAFIGIFLKRQSDFRSIALTAIIALIYISVITLLGFLRKKLQI
ncbi:MAG: tryptophan-rich sensory protein [Bacteroidales bacterium]|nr:tryptophan-rich sensory protein [Bacteroidales bacterium]